MRLGFTQIFSRIEYAYFNNNNNRLNNNCVTCIVTYHIGLVVSVIRPLDLFLKKKIKLSSYTISNIFNSNVFKLHFTVFAFYKNQNVTCILPQYFGLLLLMYAYVCVCVYICHPSMIYLHTYHPLEFLVYLHCIHMHTIGNTIREVFCCVEQMQAFNLIFEYVHVAWISEPFLNPLFF